MASMPVKEKFSSSGGPKLNTDSRQNSSAFLLDPSKTQQYPQNPNQLDSIELESRKAVPSNLRSMYKKVELMKHPASRNWLIHLHYVRKEFGTCKAIIHEELQRLNGNSEYSNYILALIYRSEGKLQESLDKLQICHKLEPNNANTVRQIARTLFLLGRHKLAIDAYEKSQSLNDDPDWETHYNLGLCYLYMENFPKAKEHMNLSLQARVSQEAFQVLGQIALARHSTQEAISVYEKAVRIFPENSELLSNLGVLYMKNGQDKISFSKLSTALAFDANHTKAIIAMASMMQTYEDYDNALGKYKVAVQQTPDSASVWNNIGMCFFGKRKYVGAISCLKRAYYLSTFDWKILHNLGLVHLHMQQYASAFHFLTAAINLKPDQSHNFMLLAVAISHLDDIEHARQAYDQAIKLNKLQKTTEPFTLYLNYAVSLFNHKQISESHKQLLEAGKYYEQDHSKIEEEEKEAFNRLKTSLLLMDYKFVDTESAAEEISPNKPENGLSETETSQQALSVTAEVNAEQLEVSENLERDLV